MTARKSVLKVRGWLPDPQVLWRDFLSQTTKRTKEKQPNGFARAGLKERPIQIDFSVRSQTDADNESKEVPTWAEGDHCERATHPPGRIQEGNLEREANSKTRGTFSQVANQGNKMTGLIPSRSPLSMQENGWGTRVNYTRISKSFQMADGNSSVRCFQFTLFRRAMGPLYSIHHHGTQAGRGPVIVVYFYFGNI